MAPLKLLSHLLSIWQIPAKTSIERFVKLTVHTYACNSFTNFSLWSAPNAITGVMYICWNLVWKKLVNKIPLLIVGTGFSRNLKILRLSSYLVSNWPSKVWIELNLGWLQPNQAKYIFNWNSSKQFLLLTFNLPLHRSIRSFRQRIYFCARNSGTKLF